MRFRRRLRTAWRVETASQPSWLVGTAHFFPHSFRRSLERILDQADVALFEGPLERDALAQVGDMGLLEAGASPLRDALDRETLDKIQRQWADPPLPGGGCLFPLAAFLRPSGERAGGAFGEGVKPWLAFFQIWTRFLERRGWEGSVDLEAYGIAKEKGKSVVFLETLAEQVAALEAVPLERITAFLRQIDRWEDFARRHARRYLQGDLEALMHGTDAFPTRCDAIVAQRDPILFARMRPYLEQGRAAAFVGMIHLPGLLDRLVREGFPVDCVEP